MSAPHTAKPSPWVSLLSADLPILSSEVLLDSVLGGILPFTLKPKTGSFRSAEYCHVLLLLQFCWGEESLSFLFSFLGLRLVVLVDWLGRCYGLSMMVTEEWTVLSTLLGLQLS